MLQVLTERALCITRALCLRDFFCSWCKHLACREQHLISRKGFRSLHPWLSVQYRTYCLPALFLLRGIRRAAPAQVTACRVVTFFYLTEKKPSSPVDFNIRL